MKRLVWIEAVLWAVVVVLWVVLAPVIVHGQSKPQNPREGTFTASADHAQVDKYVVGFFAPGATLPVQTQDLGKPTPDGTNTCTFTFNSQPLTFGIDYVARVKAVAGTAESPWSEISNPFDRVPGPPGKPVIK